MAIDDAVVDTIKARLHMMNKTLDAWVGLVDIREWPSSELNDFFHLIHRLYYKSKQLITNLHTWTKKDRLKLSHKKGSKRPIHTSFGLHW